MATLLGASQVAFLAAVGLQEDDRRLLADAFGITPDVAVEHEIAHDQHARLAEALHQIDQFRDHGSPPWLPVVDWTAADRSFSRLPRDPTRPGRE